jgi:hypothetical protein
MKDSAHAEKSHSSALGMTVTRGAGEEKSPAVCVQRSGRGYKGRPERSTYGDKGVSSPAYVPLG